MPRVRDGLFDGVASFEALGAAALRAVAGKRRTPVPAAFLANLETEVLRLERELRAGSWRPGRYVEIEVTEPKRRLVSAAPFRDRVVHHAVHAVVGPLFERGFIAHSYANRTGKGTHRAVRQYERFRDRHRHVLRGDVFRYFPAIDHAILKADLRRRIACRRTLVVLDRIIDGSNPQEPVHHYYPGDDLFTPCERRPALRERLPRRVRPLRHGGAAGAVPALRGRLRAVRRRCRTARGLEAARGGVPGGTAAVPASGEDARRADVGAGGVPRVCAAARRSAAAAGAERAPVPQAAARAAGPVARGERAAGGGGAASGLVDRARGARRYVASAPLDLPGRVVRSVRAAGPGA